MSRKEFDINKDTLCMLETPEGSTDLEKEQYYLAQLNNDEWGYNKALSKFVFKIENHIYYMRIQIKQFRCCGQTPAELVGYVLHQDVLSTGEVKTCIMQKSMETMPFTIKDEIKLMEYCFKNLY